MAQSSAAALRAWCLALVALAVWLLCWSTLQPRRVEGLTAPATSFSALRADAVLARLLGPERPHPSGTAENAAVRMRILREWAALRVHAQIYRAFACHDWQKLAYVACGTVTDILADAVPGRGKAIVLLAHYDSVPAGPGASDDLSSVATLIETVRALRAQHGPFRHPILAMATDGEEAGLLGAQAFLQNPALKARVGAVINAEARGTRGESLLFQTSAGDAPLIDLYAANVPRYATSSLYAEIYKFLPNDTDLTLFLRDGFPGFNFAFVDNVHAYHSPLDLRCNLPPGTLQMHGDNALGVARGLEDIDFAALTGGDAIDLSIFGRFLPRMPASWALPLSVAVFVAFVVLTASAFRKKIFNWRAVLKAAGMPPALLMLCFLSGWILNLVAKAVSGAADPTYAHPLPMRVALAFVLWAATLVVSQMVSAEAAIASAWLWTMGFAVLTAAYVPGASPYFLFPALVAAPLLGGALLSRDGWRGARAQLAAFASALVALVVWMGLVTSGETLMGLRLHPLFTVPAAFGLMTLVPLLRTLPMAAHARTISIFASAAIAAICALVAGLVPTYSAKSPQRVDLVYFEDKDGDARWIADTAWKATAMEPLPERLMETGRFTYDRNAWGGLALGDGYTAPAGAAQFARPTATVVAQSESAGTQTITLALRGSAQAGGMMLHIPDGAKLTALSLRGETFRANAARGGTELLCVTPDCRALTMSLTRVGHAPVILSFAEFRYGVPASGLTLQALRPPLAMPSQNGDETVLVNQIALP